jgi:23S rRNA U2552 (ribose-2'-O)-methylase RlmE/FtsJ
MNAGILQREEAQLLDLKKKIDELGHIWNGMKHDINPLEMIFTFRKKMSVARIQPISRAFFKMIELLHSVQNVPSVGVRSLHLAESPGGFIQAWNWKRRLMGCADEMVGWSLEKENVWGRLRDTSRSWSSRPFLHTGDLLRKETYSRIIEDYREEKAFFVSGDGGFDFSDDYEHQETAALRLILSQMLIGLQCLKNGGIMILKIFDCFTLPTIQILWVYRQMFETFQVVKPATSRVCNSEKYIVAQGFRGMTESLQRFLMRVEPMLFSVEHEPITTLFPEGPNASWETMCKEFKEPFTQIIGKLVKTQIEWIQKGILRSSIPESEKIKMATTWCIHHQIPMNSEYYQYHPRVLQQEDTRNDLPNHFRPNVRRLRGSSRSPEPFS